MVIANPPLAEPVIDPGGVTIKPPFEMGVANLKHRKAIGDRHKSLSLISYRKEAGPLQLYGMYVYE